MFRSIILKEWIKLRFYFLAIFIITIAILSHFWFNLNFDFSSIEPESMMWYRFVHLETKPYFYLSYFYLSFGLVISLVQFLLERAQNRIRILIHLPLKIRDSLFYHLCIGVVFISILSTILSIPLLLIISNYYPEVITQVVFKDTIAYSFASIVLYLLVSSVILEKTLYKLFIKFILSFLFVVFFIKNQYYLEDSLWLLFLIFSPFLVLDSLYSIKQQSLNSKLFKISFIAIFIGFSFIGYKQYKNNYQYEFHKYYIFYSNILKDFVYQKNFGKHHFEYGIKDKKTFDRKEYEGYLPFVYWRDLDIQKKLPLKIENSIFDKKKIKSSRFGLSYSPKMLNKLEIELYPLINPSSKIGMIKFPEEIFTVKQKEILIYDFDTGLLADLSSRLNIMLKEENFKFPVLNSWGKATNMKPFDKGYLIEDSEHKLFNLSRKNSILKLKAIEYSKNIEIAFIKISENKQNILSGYVIDKKSDFYFLDKNFNFIKLDLENFDYKNMRLKVISNPLNYLIRYDDGKNYYATVFDKKYKKIDYVEFKD